MELKSVTVEPGSNIVNGVSIIDRSSMMTYSKIVCCLCSAVIDANPRGTCEACFRKSLNIKTSIPTEFELQYCKECQRFLRPPYVKIDRDSTDMMKLCLSRIKSYDKKVKIIDSNFIYTEPHSKLIKIKVTLQKEIEKNIITQNLVIDFKEKWNLCRDCQKIQTPHIWASCVQIRQRVPHKKTMLYLEQIILHNKMQKNALDFKETNDGFDFFFTTRRAGEIFSNWLATVVPSKITYTKKYVSLSTSTFTYLVDVANVAKYDLFRLDKDSCTKLGGIGPLLVCTRLSSRTIFIDPRTFNYLYLDGNTFFKYKFISFCNSNQLSEFLILDVYEEVDYNFGGINNNNNNENKKKRNRKKKKNKKNKKDESDEEDDKDNDNQNEESSVGGSSLMSQSTNYGKGVKDEENNMNEEREHIMKCRKTFIKCIRNNKEKDTGEILEFKSYLADKIKAGEIYLGYDLNVLNLDSDNSAFLDANRNKLPDVILVRKKPSNVEIKGKKLKRLKFSNENKKNKKKMDEDDEKDDMKAFMEEIYEENDLKNNLVNENDENEKEEEINTNENGEKNLEQKEDEKEGEK
jgi:NMD protein affecting ribosome stability and mRNA decay